MREHETNEIIHYANNLGLKLGNGRLLDGVTSPSCQRLNYIYKFWTNGAPHASNGGSYTKCESRMSIFPFTLSYTHTRRDCLAHPAGRLKKPSREIAIPRPSSQSGYFTEVVRGGSLDGWLSARPRRQTKFGLRPALSQPVAIPHSSCQADNMYSRRHERRL